MKRLLAPFALGFTLAVAFAACGRSDPNAAPAATPAAATTEPAAAPATALANADRVHELRTAMRKLWEDHITYTRNYIISALADLPDQDAVAKRLLANQDEIGAAVKPYYGDEAGDKLASLLRDHITIATEVVAAARSGDKAKLDAAQAKWTANGKDLATFLAGANSNWPQADLEAMLQKHLDLTSGEVVARLHKDWAADIRSYDDGHAHMLMFADTLTDGIALQFPEKFQ
jgi:hypothetical protein